ncbi:MAG TPA: Crp/Fnr family transcriptional regulator, partial [Bacteroidia bacterium]
KSHAWERFGRLLAQEAFNVTIARTESFLFKTPEERYLELIKQHPDIFNNIPLYHISSYLGIQGPSLSRIRKRISGK